MKIYEDVTDTYNTIGKDFKMRERGRKESKLVSCSSIALAVFTIIMAVSFIVQVLRIYFDGVSKSNQSSPGVFIKPIYNLDVISSRMHEIMSIIYLWFLCLAVCIVIRCIVPAKKEKPITDGIAEWRKKEIESDRRRGNRATPKWVTPVGLAVAIALIGFGIYNGGMTDVLIKAIMICTECVGLG